MPSFAQGSAVHLVGPSELIEQLPKCQWVPSKCMLLTTSAFFCSQGELRFGPGEVEKEIEVSIIDDDMSEPDVTFDVVLTNLKGMGVVIVQVRVDVGQLLYGLQKLS